MRTLSDYEAELQQRVLTVTLLGQLPYDEGDLLALRDGLRPLFADGTADGLRRAAARAELAFALYLVLEGTYNYCAGDYWAAPRDALALSGNFAASIGEAFRRTLRRHALPTFEHLGGHTHVTPILAHVGIPDYCLPDFFDLLDRALRRDAAPDAATLMAEWGENDFPPAIDRPVQRFLRAGGPIAQDFVDRCLALWSPDADPAALALPRRVLRCFAGRPAGRADRTHAPGPRLVRPALTLDPYGEGPALALAPVVFPSGRAPARLVWGIVAGDRQREETAIRRRRGDGFEYTPRAAVNVLTVAPAYTITLLADDRLLQTWTLPGPADPPLLAFDPAGGGALPLGGDGPTGRFVLSPGERWLSYPRAWTPAPHGDARLLAELPDQPGDWAAFAFQTWRLGPGARLEFVAPDGRRVALRAHYDVPPPRPVLLGRRVAGDAPGAPALYGRPPDLLLPRHDRAEQPAAWHYAVEPIGPARPADARHGTLDALADRLVAVDEGLLVPLEAPELLGDSPFGAFRLTLRGPYGRTADFDFRCVPGLRLADYPRLYRGAADGPAAFTAVVAPGVVVAAAPGVSVGPPTPAADGRAWSVAVAADETSAALLFGGDGGIAVAADVPIHRLRWGLREPERPDRFAWSGRPLFLCPDELPARHTAELRVDRPFWGARPPPTGWRLVAPDGRVWREARPDDRRAGRYVTTALIDWLDATHEARVAACLQLLVIGEAGEPLVVPVAVLRPTLDVGQVEADWPTSAAGATLTLVWERDTRLRARQLRLWALDRPGVTQPHVLPIPDEAEGCAEWSLPPGALPPEEYLGEMVVASPWGNEDAQRPEPDAPGVFVVRPADFEGVLAARVAAVGRGQATPEDVSALLLGAVRRGQPEQLVTISRALSSRHAALPDDLLRQWADASRGCTPAYRLARAALFAPERVGAGNPSAEQVAAWLDHLPPGLPQVGLYATLLPLATADRRRLCRDELCRAGHAAGYAALLDDVGRGRIKLDDALALLAASAEAAIDFLITATHESAPIVLRALLRERPDIKLIAGGADVQTNAGYGVVTAIYDRRTGREVSACRLATAAQPYELWAKLRPANPIRVVLDLEARQIRFLSPVYKCHHNGGQCDRVYLTEDELVHHYIITHHIMRYIVKPQSDLRLPLHLLRILPPDGVKS